MTRSVQHTFLLPEDADLDAVVAAVERVLSAPSGRRASARALGLARRSELERQLQDARATVRQVRRHLGARHVDTAIERGAISADARDRALRGFERDPEMTRELLEELPSNGRRALQNRCGWTAADEAAYLEHAAALGLPTEGTTN